MTHYIIELMPVDALINYAKQMQIEINELKNLKGLSQSYVQLVPDNCDRIVWRNNYYSLQSLEISDVTIKCDESAEVIMKTLELAQKQLQNWKNVK
jgi:hypothetical protein